jgi:predicted AAA+ superfamily ATPase
LFTEFKGVLSEQYGLQQLVANNVPLFYWRPENADAEIDFLLTIKSNIIPLEIKSSDNVRSRSLSVYAKSNNPEICVRASLLPYRHQQWMENIPLYSLGAWLKKSKA